MWWREGLGDGSAAGRQWRTSPTSCTVTTGSSRAGRARPWRAGRGATPELDRPAGAWAGPDLRRGWPLTMCSGAPCSTPCPSTAVASGMHVFSLFGNEEMELLALLESLEPIKVRACVFGAGWLGWEACSFRRMQCFEPRSCGDLMSGICE